MTQRVKTGEKMIKILREYLDGETEERMALMDRCFGFERPEQKFIHILPKLYGPNNRTEGTSVFL